MPVCTKCIVEKDAAGFYRDARKSNGLQSYCKECVKARQRADRPARREWERANASKPGVRAKLATRRRERRAMNPEAERAQQRERYAKASAKHLARSRMYSIKRRFGLTEEQYDAMASAQANLCAICMQNRSVRPTFKLSVDHDHESGAIRGLLCSNCNIGLGHFDDSPSLLRAAADYIERTKVRKSA